MRVLLPGLCPAGLLTLLATPVVHSLLDDVVEWNRRRSAKRALIGRGERDLEHLEQHATQEPAAVAVPIVRELAAS